MAINQKGWAKASRAMHTATVWLGAAALYVSASLVMACDIGGVSARDLTRAQVLQMLHAEPGLADKVAAANGLSTMRMMSQETPTIAAMACDYLVRRERANAADTQRQGQGH